MEVNFFWNLLYRMPRKPRITAVPVDQPEGLMVANDLPEEKTDAEQMTEILQEVQQEPKEEPKETVSAAPVVVKPKAKRASRAKPKEEPVKEEQKEEAKEEPEEEAKEEHKGDDKVGCPDCGKQMSAKTLKYSHGPNCSSKKQKKGDEEFAKTLHTAKQIAHEIGGEHGANALEAFAMFESLNNVPEHVIEHHIRTRQRASRAVRRQEMVEKLMQNAC